MFPFKHDGCHKAQLCMDGHLRREAVETVHSGVVSLKTLHLVMLHSSLDQLELWGVDIGNAYLEATTKEKLFILPSP